MEMNSVHGGKETGARAIAHEEAFRLIQRCGAETSARDPEVGAISEKVCVGSHIHCR